jgi:hypothetical protein
MQNINIVLGLFLVYFLLCLSIIVISKYHKISKNLPKIIWTYWDSDMPETVSKLINQWKYLNPTWTINVLSKDTLPLYIKSSELPNGFYDGKESPQYSSDIVRVILLYKYGGVWVDASIMLLKSLDWVVKEFNQTNIHYLGYYMPSFTTIKDKPIIESWFIASKPNTNFMKLVYKEMKGAFGKRKDYVNRVRKTVDLQNIPETLKVYLTIHVAMQVILQTKQIDTSGFKLIDAYKDAFALHDRFHWSADKIIEHLHTDEFMRNTKGFNLIKLRGEERIAL